MLPPPLRLSSAPTQLQPPLTQPVATSVPFAPAQLPLLPTRQVATSIAAPSTAVSPKQLEPPPREAEAQVRRASQESPQRPKQGIQGSAHGLCKAQSPRMPTAFAALFRNTNSVAPCSPEGEHSQLPLLPSINTRVLPPISPSSRIQSNSKSSEGIIEMSPDITPAPRGPPTATCSISSPPKVVLPPRPFVPRNDDIGKACDDDDAVLDIVARSSSQYHDSSGGEILLGGAVARSSSKAHSGSARCSRASVPPMLDTIVERLSSMDSESAYQL